MCCYNSFSNSVSSNKIFTLRNSIRSSSSYKIAVLENRSGSFLLFYLKYKRVRRVYSRKEGMFCVRKCKPYSLDHLTLHPVIEGGGVPYSGPDIASAERDNIHSVSIHFPIFVYLHTILRHVPEPDEILENA